MVHLMGACHTHTLSNASLEKELEIYPSLKPKRVRSTAHMYSRSRVHGH